MKKILILGTDFANWRGCVSLANAYDINPAGHQWSAAGNRNMVASYVFRRPSHGNYLSLLISGFDLYQTPLLEYRSNRASWIGSQLEMVPRLGIDPAATTLFHRLISYLDNRGEMEGKTAFYGTEKARKLLKRLRIDYTAISEVNANTLKDVKTLLICEPDFGKLRLSSMDILNFVEAGGNVIYLHNSGDKFESVWLPFPLKLGKAKARQALLTGKADNFFRCGWDNNDLYWHDEYTVPVFENIPEHANTAAPGVLVDFPHGSGRFTLLAIAPADFKNKTGTGKTCRLISAVLTNAGVKLKNKSTAYLPKRNVMDCSLNLVDYRWQFALAPENKGMSEKVHEGKLGSLQWQEGLIADGWEVKLGIYYEKFMRIEYDGYSWSRLELDIPDALRNNETNYLSFGAIDDYDWVYVNGHLVGKTGKDVKGYWQAPRLYPVPGKLLKKGKNVLVVRVFDVHQFGGIYREPAVFSNRPMGSGSERGWQTPYQEGTRRDYDYSPDPVRQY